MKIGIIGGGIAGVATAYYLGKEHEITIFEKNSKLGGNVDTHFVPQKNGRLLPIDTGFISFNVKEYPLFVDFLKQLNVPFGASDMCFGIADARNGTQCVGKNYAAGLLKSLPFGGAMWRAFLYDMIRLPGIVKHKKEEITPCMSLTDFCEKYAFSEVFCDQYLYPVAAGLFSSSIENIADFPIRRVLHYLQNHGLLTLTGKSDCLYVEGGYDRYLRAATDKEGVCVKTQTPVIGVEGTTVHTEKETHVFDAIVCACEADIALKLMLNPTETQKEVLGAFKYKINRGFLHTDTSILPVEKKMWGTHISHVNPDGSRGCYSIWLNKILRLKTDETYWMTLNPWQKIDADKIVAPLEYRHLILNAEALRAQKKLESLNQKGPVYFAGSYWKYFHEDAMVSAHCVAQKINALKF
jgi:predicted NAD/FAD-binding protein